MTEIAMTGAEALVKTLEASGVDRCFTNPGTSEMHAVAAIGRAELLKATLCLFEGVATGAADGYARMARKPACTLLHLGPGLANGLANLHNARRARSPIVNIVGDHAVSHRALDAPLASDLAGFARPVSQWIKSADGAGEVAAAAAEAVAASQAAPGGIATLILPADTAWSPAEGGAEPVPATPFPAPDDAAVEVARKALAHGDASALLLSDPVLMGEGFELAAAIAEKTGARLYCDTFVARMERGAGRPFVRRLPYFAEMVEDELKGVGHLILVSTKPPVAFFAYPGRKGALTPEGAEVVHLATQMQDGLAGLRALAEAVGAKGAFKRTALKIPEAPSGNLDVMTLGAVIARHLPENAIVSDEGATCGIGTFIHTGATRPHDWLQLTGGAIGQGLPVGVGAATAAPDRKIVCIEGDGSAMYTIQSLWTAAREKLDMTVVILANRSYAILKVEMMRTGAQNPGPKTLAMFDLSNPDLGFVEMARGMGVEAIRCDTLEGFDKAFSGAMRQRGPMLIEVLLP